MLIGETLIYPTIAYTPWFPRSADGATFIVEILATTIDDDGDLKIDVEHKNSEDSDDPTVISASSFSALDKPTTPTTVTRPSHHVSGLKELVRLKLYWASSLSPAPFAHLRLLPPVWEFNGA